MRWVHSQRCPVARLPRRYSRCRTPTVVDLWRTVDEHVECVQMSWPLRQ